MYFKLSLDNPSHIPDYKLKAVIVATLSKAMMDGLKIPVEIRLLMVKKPLLRVVNGKKIKRSAELSVSATNFDVNFIRVMYGGRELEAIQESIFHETTHLLRLINDQFLDDPVLEEVANFETMNRTRPAVGTILSILEFDYEKSQEH